jgi:hypothetical protein
MIGVGSMTTIVMSADTLPAVFEAVTVYLAIALKEDGVPEISPENGSREIPRGRLGLIEKEDIGPPVTTGVFAWITTPLV